MYIIMALIFFTVVNYDTPKFLLARGKSDQCNSAVKKIYKTNGDQQLVDEICQFIASTI